MTLLDDWGITLAVLGMLVLMLLTAAFYQRYLAYLSRVRIVVGRLDTIIEEISTALEDLARVPLSRELRLTMRSDILARCQNIRSLYWRYPRIEQKIRAAEKALDAEGPASTNGVSTLENERVFRNTIAALDRLSAILGQGSTLKPVPADVRRIFLREIGERRAEVMSRFHLVEASRHDSRGNPTKARTHLLALLQALRQHGPATEFVRQLALEADAALLSLNDQRLIAEGVTTEVTAA